MSYREFLASLSEADKETHLLAEPFTVLYADPDECEEEDAPVSL